MKKFKNFLIIFIVVIVFGVIVAGVYGLTGGFTTTDVKSFALVRDGKYILSDAKGVLLRNEETFTVKAYGKDKDISASITPIELEEDYYFYVDEYEYSWNEDIVKSEEDLSQYFDIQIDQDKNTVTVRGSTGDVLKAFAGEQTLEMPSLPSADMFRLAITCGDSTMNLNCSIMSAVTGVYLSTYNITL